ncbi:acyl-CoA dehydrogenase family protein [Amycolatopsis sp. 195334CR]|uniref:acyl-CoA dehydrogenase family protein n=1 Tax=Amycolatopsis sp. 195334CR TaxID=2814588 RepID=UPI001A8F8B75|nr:acyl-CoA dehydrogenase family protein [Amycolatopsis sp. 195334CR]MBN6036974.1 acyl-CoA/acyl-ACP dehydrogenase [Amycolatopsis sp. 195334CR]
MTDLASTLEIFREAASRSDDTNVPDDQALIELRKSGLLATAVPAQYGGSGADTVELNELVSKVAEVNPSMSIIMFQHFAVCARINEWGTAEQKALWLPSMATGDTLGASAWSETGAGAAKKNLATSAERIEDGRWLLNGAKSFTTGAGVADIYLVLVGTSDGAEQEQDTTNVYGSAGQTFFLVRKENEGLIANLGLELAGMRGSATGFVSLKDCVVSDDDRLGPVGHAPAIIAGVRQSGATLGAVSVGVAKAALDVALAHFTKTGALEAPTVRHRVTELSVQVEAARAIVAFAGTRRGEDPGAVTLRSKLFASVTAEHVCFEVARMLGSAAYLVNHQLNRLISDARAVALMGPTNELCRELVSASWVK